MIIFSFIKKNSVFCLGLTMLCVLLFTAFFGKYLLGVDMELKEIDYLWTEDKIPLAPPYEPSEDFPLGTDRLGRDMWSLIVMGTKETLLVVVLITLIRYVLAVPLAYLAHKKRFGAHIILGWLNGFLSYIPTIILVVLLATLPPILVSESRPYYLILIIATLEVGRISEMMKLEFDQISSKEFIKGGLAVGISNFRLLGSYYMPFLYGKLLVNMVTDLGKVMFILGQLGFIGIFIAQEFIQIEAGQFEFQNSSITWPMMLMNAFNDIRGPIWIPFYPALAMTYVIFTFNILGTGLQKMIK